MKRLAKELENLSRSPSPCCSTLFPIEDDLYEWQAQLLGPENTPYQGGKWTVRISVPQEYPLAPPTMTFKTPICHPNINFQTGEVCLDVLKGQWSPAWGIASALMAVQAMLSDPEPDSPLNIDAANLVRSGETLGYSQLVQYYIKLYNAV